MSLTALEKYVVQCIHCMHYTMQCFNDALVYFVTAVSYERKMFVKLTPGANIIKHFTAVSYEFSE